MGLEKTPAEYVAKLVEGFREIRRVLRDDGTVWLNMGDSYNGYMANQRATSISEANQHARPAFPSGYGLRCSLKPKDLCGIPWMVAFALRDDGWWLRSDIIWSKPNPMPESVRDRPTRAHEYLFLLTKSARYFYDQQAIREAQEPYMAERVEREAARGMTGQVRNKSGEYRGNGGLTRTQKGAWAHLCGRNKRSVWTIPTQAYKAAHFATFPYALVEPCVLAGTSAKGCCPECGAPWKRVVRKDRKPTRPGAHSKIGARPIVDRVHHAAEVGNRDPQRHVTESRSMGWRPVCRCGFYGECATDDPTHLGSEPCLVLDPFMGSGTVAVVAKKLGRDFIGIELNPDYVALAEKRLREEVPLLLEASK